MRIAIDAMGGDRAPAEIVAGACAAARDFGVEVILVGDEAAIQSCFGSSNKALDKTSIEIPATLPKGVTIHHASQVVDMEEAPMQAMRKKPDSSVAVATQLHADGKADAVLSAGNTGAAATLALFKLKRIAGIDRPGIASVFPTSKNPTVVLDVGANVDCKPRHLAEFAVMGAAYARNVKEIIPGVGSWIPKGKLPTVGLLSIGEEESKGNDLTKSAFKLLQDNADEGKYQFFGNVEGRDIGKGTVDVVVCDGFVGNVVLKVSEGLAKMLTGELKSALTSSPRSKLGALLLKPALMRMRKRLDYTGYGGALLLGVNGVCVICHGSADARSIHSAIRIAKQTVSADVVGAIRSIMEDSSGAIEAQQKALDEASANASASASVNGANPQNTLHQNGSGGEKLSDGIVPPISF
ncbi:MAG TPA: phosphate acyltransferase PlsX [Abditibacteriaceae bacterium]|jgi:glycerol-3-phosphate acyltransferase PlsX